jgi:exodeoxyribonuclease V alpha subunit
MTDASRVGSPLERDPFDPRTAAAASGLLAAFNRAGVLSAADVHVARRLGTLAGETGETVLLAVALAVRAPRLGHVLVDLASIRETATVDAEEAVDLATLDWPEPAAWIDAVAASPLVGGEGEGDAAQRPLRLGGGRLYLDRYWTEEVSVARALRAMVSEPVAGIDETMLAAGIARLFADGPDERQQEAAAAAVRRRFAVVAGGPGTGKTTTVAKIVALLCEQAGVGDGRAAPLIALAAPTGKAAARMQEAVHGNAAALDVSAPVRAALQTAQASTIHRLLGWRPDSNSRFRHDRSRRLPHDVVIVDETSMVSLSLMARLIEALRSDARLVLVGDSGQLASIEAGAVLGDIVGAGAPADTAPDSESIVVLDRGHRFGGAIARLAAAIGTGDGDAVIELLRCGDDAVRWIETDPSRPDVPALLREQVVATGRAVLEAARAGDVEAALEALGSFRILCAHRRGAAGVTGWTARAEGWLAEAAGLSTADRWYLARPLLVTENDYELGLNNGDTGVIVDAGTGRLMAGFERGGAPALYSTSRLGAVETVYAMTIHKSQGSQFGAVAVVLPEPGSRILSRELLYTAATRARQQLVLVGDESTIRDAVARPVARASGLGARLWSQAGG